METRKTLSQLLDGIREKQGQFSASQKLVAAYVVENSYQIPFLSITQLAKNIGVSDNTVIKFCNQLGFAKFGEFKKAFSEYAHSELIMSNKLSRSDSTCQDLLMNSMEEDLNAIRATLTDPSNQQALEQLLPMLGQAKHIYITGGRASAYMAGLLTNALRYLGLKVFAVDFGVGDYWDKLAMVEREDLVIAFSMPRYTAQVVQGLESLHRRQVPIALITDTGLSPAHKYGDPVFHCVTTSDYYFPGYAGCMALINAIYRAAGAERRETAADHISGLERQLLEKVFIK